MTKKEILWIVGLNIASYFLVKLFEIIIEQFPKLAQIFQVYIDVNFYYAIFVAFLNILILSVILKRQKKSFDTSPAIKCMDNEQNPILIFYDNFYEDTEWKKYGDGKVYKTGEISWCGKFSLKKDSNPDPYGGYRLLGRKIKAQFIFSGWIYRSDIEDGRWADRIAIEDQDNNGYGVCVSHGNHRSYIEKRVGGRGHGIGSASIYTPPLNKWYHFIIHFGLNGRFKLRLYDANGVCIADVPEVNDMQFKEFDRIVVHGGFPYFIGELKIVSI